jgi:hypothetical protein
MQSNHDLAIWCGPSPDVDRHAALQHSVIAQDVWQLYLGPQQRRQQCHPYSKRNDTVTNRNRPRQGFLPPYRQAQWPAVIGDIDTATETSSVDAQSYFQNFAVIA